MRHRYWSFAGVAVALLAILSFAGEAPIQGAKIEYYPLEKFSSAPAWVLAKLKARGCRIPQANYFNSKPHNLIRGEFAKKGQVDWAVLCSKSNKSSSIVLLSLSKQKCAEELAIADDSNFVQQVDSNQYQFSRLIKTATKSDIAQYRKREGDQPPLMDGGLDHEGIIDEFAGKGSSIYYCKDGKWVELPGGD